MTYEHPTALPQAGHAPAGAAPDPGPGALTRELVSGFVDGPAQQVVAG